MKKYVLAACLLAAFASCKKEAPQQNIKPSQLTSVSKDEVDDCANPDNPFDYAGYDHNQGLQATRNIWAAQNATMQDATGAIATYCLDKYGTVYSDQDAALAAAINDDDANDYANIISNSSLSDAGKTVATQLVATMTDIPKTTNYSDYKASIVAFEAQIMANDNLTDSDKESLLKSSSVARYSMCYWINEMTDGNPVDSNPVQCRNIFHRIRDWWNAASARFDRADAYSYLATGDGGVALGSSLDAFFNP